MDGSSVPRAWPSNEPTGRRAGSITEAARASGHMCFMGDRLTHDFGGQGATGEALWGRCTGPDGDLWEQVYDGVDEGEEALDGAALL